MTELQTPVDRQAAIFRFAADGDAKIVDSLRTILHNKAWSVFRDGSLPLLSEIGFAAFYDDPRVAAMYRAAEQIDTIPRLTDTSGTTLTPNERGQIELSIRMRTSGLDGARKHFEAVDPTLASKCRIVFKTALMADALRYPLPIATQHLHELLSDRQGGVPRLSQIRVVNRPLPR